MSDLISDEYLEQLRLMRTEQYKPRWGVGGSRHAMAIHALIMKYKATSVLDYGCGQGALLEALQNLSYPVMPTFAGYDPGMPQFAALPEPAALLVSTDVLEHIEPDKLDGVLTHIRSLTLKAAYINVHTHPANAILPDGRNAHLIQKPVPWWQEKLSQFFRDVRYTGGGAIRPTFLCE